MRRPQENREGGGVAEAAAWPVPDPRNIGQTVTWPANGTTAVLVDVDYGDRAAFERSADLDRGITLRERDRRHEHAFAVNEVIERGLVDVDVIAPRPVEADGYVVACRGSVVSWADAVRYEFVPAVPQ